VETTTVFLKHGVQLLQAQTAVCLEFLAEHCLGVCQVRRGPLHLLLQLAHLIELKAAWLLIVLLALLVFFGFTRPGLFPDFGGFRLQFIELVFHSVNFFYLLFALVKFLKSALQVFDVFVNDALRDQFGFVQLLV